MQSFWRPYPLVLRNIFRAAGVSQFNRRGYGVVIMADRRTRNDGRNSQIMPNVEMDRSLDSRLWCNPMVRPIESSWRTVADVTIPANLRFLAAFRELAESRPFPSPCSCFFGVS